MSQWKVSVVGLILLLAIAGSTWGQITAVRGKVVKIHPQGLQLQSTESPGSEPQTIRASAQTPVRMNYLASIDQIVPGTYVEMQVLWDGAQRLRATSIKLPDGLPTKFGLFEG